MAGRRAEILDELEEIRKARAKLSVRKRALSVELGELARNCEHTNVSIVLVYDFLYRQVCDDCGTIIKNGRSIYAARVR